MGAEGIGQFIGSLLRARPQSNPDFLNQVNAGLTPSVNPYLAPTSQLKRVFGNNADELNMAYAGTTGRGILESRDAMQKMQEANKLAKLRDEAQAELQSQAAYDDYTLDAARNKENQRFTLQRDDAQFGTPEERARQRQLKFDTEKLALDEAKAEGPTKTELQRLALEEAQRKAAEEEAYKAFLLKHPGLLEQIRLNRADPPVKLGTGDSILWPGTGRAAYGPVPVETPGPLDPYGRRGESTRRFVQPPSIGPNPAVYSPGSLLEQNNGDKLDTGGVYNGSDYLNPTLKSWLRSSGGSSLTASPSNPITPPVPVANTGLPFVDQQAKNAQDQLYIDEVLGNAAAQRRSNESELNRLLPTLNRNIALSRGITLPGSAGYGESDPIKRAGLLGQLRSQIDTLQRKLGTAYE